MVRVIVKSQWRERLSDSRSTDFAWRILADVAVVLIKKLIHTFLEPSTGHIKTEIVTGEAPISLEEATRESSVEVTERPGETMKVPGSEIDFAPVKTEVSEVEHTEKETSVGKFYVT